MAAGIEYYQVWLIDTIVKDINSRREKLLFELVTNTLDPIIFKRRCRMLTQLSHYESQIITKIKNFKTDNQKDYERALSVIFDELIFVTSRNA